MLGERVSADVGLEAQLGLRLTSPLLVPLGHGEDALLLDGGHLGMRVDRVRVATPYTPPASPKSSASASATW